MYIFSIKVKVFEGIMVYYYFKELNIEYFVCKGLLSN